VRRIGYLSATFAITSWASSVAGDCRARSSALEVRAYALAPPETLMRLRRSGGTVDEFVNVAALDDRAAAEAIAADDLDLSST
jgi:predicted O-linked N-acetylglucosamine transferase (SPINDLY family)